MGSRAHIREGVELHVEGLEERATPAAVGALDPSFGTAGVTAAVAGNEFRGVAIQEDGKIVAVGGPAGLGGPDFFVMRYNPDGTVDTSFGTAGTGRVTVDVGGAGQVDNAYAVAVDADNNIVVVGSGGAAVPDFALVKLSNDGKIIQLNTHFHVGNAGDGATARAVAFQSDGTIVIAGDARFGGDRDFAAARVNPATGAVIGSPITTSFVLADDIAYAVAVYPGGPNKDKIVLEGTTGAGDIGIKQRNADLTADTTFNGTGQETISVSGSDSGSGVAITPGGSIVVSGTNGAVNRDMVVAQLLPTGAFDPAFNAGAVKTISKAGNDLNRALAVQPDGKIVLVGDSASTGDVGVFRLTPDGTALDTSFGGTGDATFDVSGNDDGNAVAIDPNGRIVIAGDNGVSAGFLARLTGAVEHGKTLVTGGAADGTIAAYAPAAATGQYATTPFVSGAAIPGFTGSVRVAAGDVNGDGFEDAVVVTGPGVPIKFAVISGKDNTTYLVLPTAPFAGSEDFTGGGFVAAGDLDHDGRAEVVVTPDQGGGPRVTVFSLNPNGTLATRGNFFGIDDPNFRGGCRAALGDVNGDGTPDVAVAAGFLGGPRIALFDGKTVLAAPTRLVGDFFAFPGADAVSLRNGAYVALGDVNGDGFDDLIFGGGPGGAPRVFILSGQTVSGGDVAGAYAAPVANFFVADNSTDRGGVRVAAKDADRDNHADVSVGSGEGTAARVRTYLGKNFTSTAEPAVFQDLTVFGGDVLAGGVFVG